MELQESPEQEPAAPQEDPASEIGLNPDDYSEVEDVATILSGYWANKDGDELYGILRQKEEEFYTAAERRGLVPMCRTSYAQYYGLSNSSNSGPSGGFESQTISFEGENGELLAITINEFRSYCDQIFNMTTKNRPSFEAQAVNTDADSLSGVEAANQYLQYYFEQTYGERKEHEVVKIEGLHGKGWTHIEWDPDGGPDVQIDTQVPGPPEAGGAPLTAKETVKSGEFIISALPWWRVIAEPYRSEFDIHLWRMVVFTRSKWEMIARYPIKAKEIEGAGYEGSSREFAFPGSDPARRDSDDMLTCRIFYHARSGAVPRGRKVLFVGSVMVADEDLPIDDIPLIDLMSCELQGTSFGMSDLWNLIPLNQLKAQIMSDVATNIEAFGRPPLVLTEGSDIDLDALANGQKVVFKPRDTDDPAPMKFPQIPDVTFKVFDLLRTLEQSISGLNAVFRGEPQSNITSGAMAALFDNRAIENQSPRQAALDLMRERIGNVLLQYLKRYATHPQLVAIAGEDERGYIESFTKEDLAGVHRVVVKTANPMLRSQAGRMQLAEILRQWPGQPISDPAQIIALITTGQWKPMYQETRASQLHIKTENEELMKGPPIQQVEQPPDPLTGMPTPPKQVVSTVAAVATENARDHIMGHLEVYYSPLAQRNPAVKDACMAHILDHVDVARNNDPYLAQILGLPAPQSAMQPAQDPNQGKPGQDQGPGASPSSDASSPDQTDDSFGAQVPKPAKPPAQALNQNP